MKKKKNLSQDDEQMDINPDISMFGYCHLAFFDNEKLETPKLNQLIKSFRKSVEFRHSTRFLAGSEDKLKRLFN
jgi:hypothetical protein